MNSQKKVADILERCYFSKSSEEDIAFLLDYFIKTSSLSKIVKDNKPIINLDEISEVEGRLIAYGEYCKERQVIYINKKLIDEVKIAYPCSFTLLFDTLGHEIEHHFQFVDQKKYSQTFEKWNKEDVMHLCKAINKPNSENLCKDISYASYLKQADEEEARDAGAKFVEEAYRILLQNQYLTSSVRKKLEEELNDSREYLKQFREDEQYYYEVYDVFLDYYKDRKLYDFMNEFTKGKQAKKYLNAIDFWLSIHTQEEIANNYFMLLGAPHAYDVITDYLTNYIGKEDFSSSIKNNLVTSIVYFLSNKNPNIDTYDKRLFGLLSEKDILKIYDALLREDVSKIKASLFKAIRNDCICQEHMAKIIAKNKNVLLTQSQENKKIIIQEIDSICSLLNYETNKKIIKELESIKNNLNIKKQVNL